MTGPNDYDEHLLDMTYPNRAVVTMECFPDHEEAIDHQSPVLDLVFNGQHCVIAAFCLDDDFTVDIALFDKEGRKVRHRLMSIMSADNPFITGGEP